MHSSLFSQYFVASPSTANIDGLNNNLFLCEPFPHSPRCILVAVALNRMFFLPIFYKWLHYILFSGFSVERAEYKSRLVHFRFEKICTFLLLLLSFGVCWYLV